MENAIGLQAVDGLQTSNYLKDTAVRHIEGDISIDEVKALIDGYYRFKTLRSPDNNDTEEADKVAANITRILNENSFAYSVTGFTSIHRRLFEGVFKFAGRIRDYDITKKEWVLRGDTVLSCLRNTLGTFVMRWCVLIIAMCAKRSNQI